MIVMSAGITKAGEGIEGISWNILGQTYVPKQLCETSFSWHATLPPGTMVPKLVSGRPNRSHSQRMTRFSMAVPLGACRHDAAF